jgi:hypothetical protein
VSRSRTGIVLRSWNIDSTVYCQTSWNRCINYSSPIDGSPSEVRLRIKKPSVQE